MKSQIFRVDDYRTVFGLDDNPAWIVAFRSLGAEFASETADGKNTIDENNVNAMVRRRIIVFSCVSFLSYSISENNSFPTQPVLFSIEKGESTEWKI